MENRVKTNIEERVKDSVVRTLEGSVASSLADSVALVDLKVSVSNIRDLNSDEIYSIIRRIKSLSESLDEETLGQLKYVVEDAAMAFIRQIRLDYVHQLEKITPEFISDQRPCLKRDDPRTRGTTPLAMHERFCNSKTTRHFPHSSHALHSQ